MIIGYMIAMTALAAVNNVLHFRNYGRNTHLYSLLFFSLFICCTGHLFLALATTAEGAMIAVKTSYAGSAFLPFFLFCAILQVCHVRFQQMYQLVLFLLSFAIFGLVCTIGYNDIYYKGFQYTIASGVGNYTVESYGWGHDIFNIMLAIYLVANVSIIVHTFFKKKNVSYKSLFALAMIETSSIASFLIARVMENDMLIMPAVYVFDQVLLLYICERVKHYDISESVLRSLEAGNSNGYASISANEKFLGGNDIAYSHFPELRECRVDHTLPQKPGIVQFFKEWANEIRQGNIVTEKEFDAGDRHFKCTAKKAGLTSKNYATLFKIEEDTEYHRYVQMLGNDNSRLQQLAQTNATQIHAIQEQMIVNMASMVESRDSNTGGHIKRTSKVVAILAEEMQRDPNFILPKKFYEALIIAAPMHDIGKIAIDDMILRKPGRFTPEEFEVMKSHAAKGAVIVENLLSTMEEPYLVQIARNVAHYHHERYDGSGYPHGLSGELIPFEARVMAVADVYDALVSRRCYKERMDFSEANDIIMNSMGTHFDPRLKKSFINCREKLEAYYRQVTH